MFVIFGSRDFVAKINVSVNKWAYFQNHLEATFDEFPKMYHSETIDTTQITTLVEIFEGCTNPDPLSRLSIQEVSSRFQDFKKKLKKRRVHSRNIQTEELEEKQ
jgi:hypothetical protein